MNQKWLLIGFLLFGLICETNSQVITVPYHDLVIDCPIKDDTGKIIINSKADFQKHTTCLLPDFDFESYTIFGIQGLAGGCEEPSVDFFVFRDDSNKKYLIKVRVRDNGACRIIRPYKRIIFVDKLRGEYTLEFLKI